MLASRLVFTDQAYIISSRNQTPRSGPKQFTSTNNQGLYSVATNDHIIEIHGGENNIVQTSSQEHILEFGAS
jgi:hypothetical protein